MAATDEMILECVLASQSSRRRKCGADIQSARRPRVTSNTPSANFNHRKASFTGVATSCGHGENRFYSPGSQLPAPGLRAYFLQDANWDTTAVVGFNSTAGPWGATQRYVYSPYGSITVLNADWSTPPAGTQPVVDNLYQGMTLDAVTGLYYERFRNYSPSLGTWISQDPLSYVNGANTYQFVMSGPVGATDPMGETVVGSVYIIRDTDSAGNAFSYVGSTVRNVWKRLADKGHPFNEISGDTTTRLGSVSVREIEYATLDEGATLAQRMRALRVAEQNLIDSETKIPGKTGGRLLNKISALTKDKRVIYSDAYDVSASEETQIAGGLDRSVCQSVTRGGVEGDASLGGDTALSASEYSVSTDVTLDLSAGAGADLAAAGTEAAATFGATDLVLDGCYAIGLLLLF